MKFRVININNIENRHFYYHSVMRIAAEQSFVVFYFGSNMCLCIWLSYFNQEFNKTFIIIRDLFRNVWMSSGAYFKALV